MPFANDFVQYKRENFLKRNGTSEFRYLEILAVCERICKAHKNGNLGELSLDEYDSQLLEALSLIVKREQDAICGNSVEN